MTDFEQIVTSETLNKAIRFLGIKFPVKAISEATGYGKSTVSMYLKGSPEPSGDFLQKFEEKFDISLKDFVGENVNEVVKKQDDVHIDYIIDNAKRLETSNEKFRLFLENRDLKVEIRLMQRLKEGN